MGRRTIVRPASNPPPKLNLQPLDPAISFRSLAYRTLKQAITEMDIYSHPEDIRLDERRLSQDLAISRTPVREAITILEREGFVRSTPRRGIFVVRKTKAEILEMIAVWAALESMSARFAAQNASDADLAALREMFAEFRHEKPADHLSEYSDANIAFHQTIIRLGACKLIADITGDLFIHMRAIRKVTIGQDNRAERSIIDHMNIIESLAARDAERAGRLVREHTFGLYAHIEKHGDFLG
ncbi:MAG: GntR family transcriptional regulator [Rhizobiaceae bacterium]|jgi:DNA-binding GntR family transcriptional regulator|nr:GntR family transcriptional regulator [Rhizobiaceae bacterium]